jgi:septation ring formation regulator EzrA
MAAELDDRWEELSQRHAGDMARYELLSWRIAELQTSLNELLDKRDAAYEEMRRARQRTFELRETADRQREVLRELTQLAERQLIVVPDMPEAAPEPVTEAG